MGGRLVLTVKVVLQGNALRVLHQLTAPVLIGELAAPMYAELAEHKYVQLQQHRNAWGGYLL